MVEGSLIENGDLRVKRCRHGLMLYSLNDVFIGRSFDRYGEYCEQEVELYKSLLAPGDVVVDCGANIGAHTLFFAQTVAPDGWVVAFEPQRIVYQMLCANLALNGVRNAWTWHGGVGASQGRAMVPPVDYDHNGNFGAPALSREGPGESVSVMSLDELKLSRCNLIKIDVQGMEAEVLDGARVTIEQFDPILYVENDLKEKSPDLIGKLFELGYRVFWHLPGLYSKGNFFEDLENIFGDTINVNMLCLPRSDDREVRLHQIASPQDWWRTT